MNGRAWTTSEARQLRDMRAKGFTAAEIGRVLGRSKDAVYAFNRDYGKYRRAPVRTSQSQAPSERLRIATLIAIAAYANDNRICIDTAARRLLMGEA